MIRRFVCLLLSGSLLWFATANLWSGAPDCATDCASGSALANVWGAQSAAERESAAQSVAHSAAAIDSPDGASRFAANAPILDASRWAIMGPALPASMVAAPNLHSAPVAARDVARTVVPQSAASLQARRARHLASIRATSTVHRLDALWRADAQRLLAIPQYAIAPPLIG